MEPSKAIVEQQPAVLLDLALETVLEVAAYLDKEDVMTLRSTCSQLDNMLLDGFANQYFNKLYLLPTPHTLENLIHISKCDRLSSHVKELTLCPSIYQHQGHAGYGECRNRPADPRTNPRIVEEDKVPYPNPSSQARDAANKSFIFLIGHDLRRQLTTALRCFNVNKIEIHAWPRKPSLPLGLSHHIRQTGRNPFKAVIDHKRPVWDCEAANLVTRLTQDVLDAVCDSGTSLTTLIIGRVQLDALKLAPGLESHLNKLTHLELGISLLDKKLDFESEQKPQFDIFTLIEQLPCLESLAMTNSPCKPINHVELARFLPSLRLNSVRKLSLGDFEDCRIAVMIPFIKDLPASVQDLTLTWSHYDRWDSEPWNILFTNFKRDLCVQHLCINMEGNIFNANGQEEIDAKLTWLAENMPQHWSILGEGEYEEMWTKKIDAMIAEDDEEKDMDAEYDEKDKYHVQYRDRGRRRRT